MDTNEVKKITIFMWIIIPCTYYTYGQNIQNLFGRFSSPPNNHSLAPVDENLVEGYFI